MSADVQTRPTTAPRRVTGLAHLTLRLTAARFRAREGEALLYFAGILATTVAAALGLTVAGGTWLFFNRWQHPTGFLAEVMADDPRYDTITEVYFVLAIVACALLVPALVNLAAGAAVLGACGRERRLAALRLMGLSSGDAVRMSLLDALIQAAIGTVLGAGVYFATLGLWANLEMLAMPLAFDEMLLPAWLFAAVVVAVIAIAMFAAWRGLRQVRISPLGVSRRSSRPALSWIRAGVFIAIMVVASVGINTVRPNSEIANWLVFAGIILAVIAGLNVVAPWLLQVVARGLAHLPWPSMQWAARRIVADPAATWRRVSGMGLLAFIGGFMALMPITMADQQDAPDTVQTFVDSTQWDLTKGVIITLAVGFVLTATSMLITQASATIERREQSEALQRMGAPSSFSLKTMWLETFGPLALAVVGGAGLGMFMASPMLQVMAQFGLDPTMGIRIISGVLVTGLVLAAAALLASHPLHHSLLRKQERRND